MADYLSRLHRAITRPARTFGPLVPTAPAAPRVASYQERISSVLGNRAVLGPGAMTQSASEALEAPTGIGGALRRVASFLEPLALPQDAFFAAIAGAVDPKTTISERLGRMVLKDYLPGGEAPERPATGEEILSLMGFDEQVAKWGGLGADLLVDPLVFGSWLRVGGKLAKVDELVRLGDRVDTFISPLGMARETNKLLRRSSAISAWQDARMERILTAFRDPNSVVFGIQRFGEKATKALEYVLPRDSLLKLRFGEEVGRDLLKLEQRAAESGRKLSREMLTLFQRIQYGTGESGKAVIQRIVQTLEGQGEAWERHLSSITDPLERRFIETATYAIAARQTGKRGEEVAQKASFLTELSPERIPDDIMSNLYEEAIEALGRFEDFGFDAETARRLGLDQDLGQQIVDVARASVEPEKQVLRERLRAYVGERARRAGLADVDVVREQRRAVHVFEEYLAETVRIDARVGLELSGLPYIGEMLRKRVVELTGDFDEADRLYKRILNAGLTRGQAGIDELLTESTGITLHNVADNLLADTAKRFERQRMMYAATDDLLNRIRQTEEAFASRIDAVKEAGKLDKMMFRRSQERLTHMQQASEEVWKRRFSSVADGRRAVLLNGTDDLEEYARIYTSRMREMWNRLDGYVTPGGSELKGLKAKTLRYLTGMEDLVERYSMALAKVTTAPASELTRNLIAQVVSAEQRLINGFRTQAGLYDELITKLGRPARPTPVRTVATTVEEVAEGAGETVYRVKVPKNFYEDHVGRELPAGKVLRTLRNQVEVELSAEDYAELLDDARFYTSGAADDIASVKKSAVNLEAAAEGRRLIESARRTVRALEAAKPVSRAGPTTARAVREATRESRGPFVSPRAAAASDPDLAEELFQGPADLYDELSRLRSIADEIRLDLEDALTSKTSLPVEVDLPASQFAAQSRQMAREVKGHRRTIKANEAEQAAARRAEVANIRAWRNQWRAVEAAEAGVRRIGGTAHLRREAERAKREFGMIGRAARADAIPTSGRNTTLEDIMARRAYDNDQLLLKGQGVNPDTLADLPVTFEELLGGMADMQALKIGDYLEGLMSGHLRRAYGLFIDEGDFNRYLDKLRGGGIIASNVLDEDNLLGNLPGFEREAGLIAEFHNALKSAGGGVVLRRDDIVEYLATRGVSNDRINQVLVALNKAVTSSPRHHANIDAIVDHVGRYTALKSRIETGATGAADPRTVLRVRNQQLFAEQQAINDHMAGLLGEYALASMSTLENIQAANRVLPRQRYFQDALKLAQDRGLVKGGKFTDQYGAVYRLVDASDNAIGGFGGKYVHPYLYQELQRMAAVKKPVLPAAFTRLRALVTGGYLASPAVLAANVAGGFYQSATAGFNPAVIAKRLVEVFPELRKTARGEWSELVEEINKHLPIDLTTLIGNIDPEDIARLVRFEAGVGVEGIRGWIDQAAHNYERFLQRPFGMRFAGLEGFQFTENWFKVAAYKEMKERVLREGIPGPNGRRIKVGELRAQEIAAEAARTVVFDYSTLPTSLNALKRWGLLMFPGFPFFIAGRTLAAALERPGTVALADRIAEAVSNASLSFEDQAALWLGMPDWLKGEQGVPLPGVTTRDDGSRQVSVIPMAQLVPTTTVWDSVLTGDLGQAGNNPWAESVTQLGMWGPLYDIISALATGSGEAPISGRFGHVVFQPGSNGVEKMGNVIRFLYNTMAPSVVRKGLSIDYQDRAQGLVPSLIRAVMDGSATSPDDLLTGVYSFEERRTGRPDRGWRDGVIASILRTPQVIALDGPLAGIRSEMGRERNALNAQISDLNNRYNKARATGQTATAEEMLDRMRTLTGEFNERWREYLEFYNAYQNRRRP